MLSIHAQKLFAHMQHYYCSYGWRESGKLGRQNLKDTVLIFDCQIDADAVIDELQLKTFISSYAYTESREGEYVTEVEYVLNAMVRKQMIEDHCLALMWKRMVSGLEPFSPYGEIAQVRRALRTTEPELQNFYRATERLLIVERAIPGQSKNQSRWILTFCAGDHAKQRYILADAFSYAQARIELEIVQDELISRMYELFLSSLPEHFGEIVADSLLQVCEQQKHPRINGRWYWVIQAVLWRPQPYYRVVGRPLIWRLRKNDPTGDKSFRVALRHRTWIATTIMQLFGNEAESGKATRTSFTQSKSKIDEKARSTK